MQTMKQKKNYDIISTASRYTKLKQAGNELKGLCPIHTERTPSFTVNPSKQVFYCFGCQGKGDSIDLVQAIHGVGFTEAVRILESGSTAKIPKQNIKTYRQKTDSIGEPVYEPILPDYKELYPKLYEQYGEPKTYIYRNESGAYLQFVFRWNYLKNGEPKKEIRPCTWDGKQWIKKAYKHKGKAPLYRLDCIQETETLYILAEGEKATEAIIQAGRACLGYKKEWNNLDFTPLQKRKVLVWGDAELIAGNDLGGLYKAKQLAKKYAWSFVSLEHLEAVLGKVRKGTDAGDLTSKQIQEVITRAG